jgi:hypothetical protein
MVSGFPQERIIGIQDWMPVWLAVCKPLVETVHMLYRLSLVRNVVNAGADDSEEANPHPGCMVREVCISIPHSHASSHVGTDGIIPIHRKAALDGLLAAFSVPGFVELDGCIPQAAALNKRSNNLANAC